MKMKIKLLWLSIVLLLITVCVQRYENRELEANLRDLQFNYESLGEEFMQSVQMYEKALEENRGNCK